MVGNQRQVDGQSLEVLAQGLGQVGGQSGVQPSFQLVDRRQGRPQGVAQGLVGRAAGRRWQASESEVIREAAYKRIEMRAEAVHLCPWSVSSMCAWMVLAVRSWTSRDVMVYFFPERIGPSVIMTC